jgi:transposase-like protein
VLRYEELTAPERELWDAFPEGRQVDLRSGSVEADDVRSGHGWGPERTVRAEVLTALLLGQNSEQSGRVAALRLVGARVTGPLALEGAEVRYLLRPEGCWLEEEVRLDSASTLAIAVVRCRVPGFLAPSARIGGRLDLRGSVIEGRGRDAVELMHVHVAGSLRLDGAMLSAPVPDGIALSAGGIVMDGAVVCEGGFHARGEVVFAGAHLSGGLFMRGARLETPDGIACASRPRPPAPSTCAPHTPPGPRTTPAAGRTRYGWRASPTTRSAPSRRRWSGGWSGSAATPATCRNRTSNWPLTTAGSATTTRHAGPSWPNSAAAARCVRGAARGAICSTQGDRSTGQIAKDFDLTETAVRDWVKQAEVDSGERDGLTSSEREELAALRRENRRLREDVDILKRATAFFAKEIPNGEVKSLR